MLQKLRWLLLLLGVVVVVIVAMQNSKQVELRVLFFSGRYSLTLLILATAAISFVLGALTTGYLFRSKKKPSNDKKTPDSPRPSKTAPDRRRGNDDAVGTLTGDAR